MNKAYLKKNWRVIAFKAGDRTLQMCSDEWGFFGIKDSYIDSIEQTLLKGVDIINNKNIILVVGWENTDRSYTNCHYGFPNEWFNLYEEA